MSPRDLLLVLIKVTTGLMEAFTVFVNVAGVQGRTIMPYPTSGDMSSSLKAPQISVTPAQVYLLYSVLKKKLNGCFTKIHMGVNSSLGANVIIFGGSCVT